MTIRENVQSGICWIIDNREDGMPSKFASRIGVDRQKVNQWKNGRNAPDLEKLRHSASILPLIRKSAGRCACFL